MDLNMLNFFSYFEDEEMPNGDYWKFAQMTKEQMIEIWNDKEVIEFGRFINLSEIIFKIKNPNLKSKMKEQLKIIINISKDMDYISRRYPVYTEEELKQIVESLMNSILESNPTSYEIMKIDNYNIKDKKWLIEIYDKIFRSIDDENENVEIDKAEMLLAIKNNKVVEELARMHKDELPKEFLKYLEVKKDDEYVIRKARKYSELKIGIDPNIKIGAEIEANNKINIFFNTQYQNGLEEYYSHNDATVPDRY